ncbi:hypothetical protein ACLI09_17700 [Flavobacterium sp. RHBU_24]|uniref:hypothetical protein n=1 Tax=Flavobacterium sp. RHBU_24 TaxID=3391185 RepID=UPI0039852338
MIKITKDTDIEAGNTIYNPAENVRYQVDAYLYDTGNKTEVAHLKPRLPFGTHKKAFTLTIESLVTLGYKVDND